MLGTAKTRGISKASASSEFTDSLCIQDKAIKTGGERSVTNPHRGSGSTPFILTLVLGAPVPEGIHRQQLLTSLYVIALEFSHFSDKTL